MFVKAGIVLAAPVLLLMLVAGAGGVVVVDVQEGGADGHHLVVPVPVALAQLALTFAPEEARHVVCPDFAPYHDLALRVLKELEQVPDCTLVRVEEKDESIRIQKEGRSLRVDVVDGEGEEVHVSIPIHSAIRFVESYDGEGFHTRAVLSGLRGLGPGTIVDVRDCEDRVRIHTL
jgi:hypothetical protein